MNLNGVDIATPETLPALITWDVARHERVNVMGRGRCQVWESRSHRVGQAAERWVYLGCLFKTSFDRLRQKGELAGRFCRL